MGAPTTLGRKYSYDHPRPMLTADIVLFGIVEEQLSTLLIRRKHDPYQGRWAFPGGFVDEYERPELAARRELREETGVDVDTLRLFGAFGQRGRDPRGWTVTVSYYAIVDAPSLSVAAGDDAASVAWKPIDRTGSLAFDHREMLQLALSTMRENIYTRPDAKRLLDSPMSPSQLHKVYRHLDRECPAPAALIARLQANGILQRVGRSLRFPPIG